MPKRQPLSNIAPNRYYEIDATLKYKHEGPNTITGIIEQGQVQTKISIPKDGVELEEGKQYIFTKCFNSRNGWLYAKSPSSTIIEKDHLINRENYLTLREIFQKREQFVQHYISTQLKVISVEPKITIQKNEQALTLYNLKGFSDELVVNLEVWNLEIQPENIINKILNFIGFRVKQMSHNTIALVSTVYSKIQKPSRLPYNRERFIFDPSLLYKSISSPYDIRTIEQALKVCEQYHKSYSICLGSCKQVENQTYEGCQNCKRKVQSTQCSQCGQKMKKQKFHYLKVVIEDSTGMIQCAIFDQATKKAAETINQKAYFFIKSSAKKNYENGQFYVSHVITGIKNEKIFE